MRLSQLWLNPFLRFHSGQSFVTSTLILVIAVHAAIGYRFTTTMEGMDEMDDENANCTNDYCIPDEDYIALIFDEIFPHSYDWALIAMHGVVFIVGLIGNALVCLAVYRNHSMRTVTNYFLVNLAIADLLVILVCLPPTVVWDITETWFLGLELCKIVPYMQTVSVSVSILTLTFISIDRWYAVCFPLKFRSTTGRAKTAIIFIWIFALLFDIPDLLVLQVVPAEHIRVKSIYYTQCAASWSKNSRTAFTIVKLVFLYTGPLIFMSFAYWQIARVLWKSDIPGHNSKSGFILKRKSSGYVKLHFSLVSTRSYAINELSQYGAGNSEGQLRSRRKAAKMLVAVVLMFAFCYFPVHLLQILRHTVTLPSTQVTTVASLLAHWLCYANSAINPVIYNFMSGKFRKEFKRTFCCPQNHNSHSRIVYRARGDVSLHSRRLRSNATTRSITTTNNNNVHQSTEVIPLSAITNVAHHKHR